MISLALAKQLKEAGLIWRTGTHDFFGIPDRGLDDQVFVISDIMAMMELLQGWPAITFHGTSEWALDYIWTHELVWLPAEGQLRAELENHLPPDTNYQLIREEDLFRCVVYFPGKLETFWGDTAVEVYAQALLFALKMNAPQ
ncbi:MAG: pilus assembly protein CpaE [Chloroflexi bacterium]|nr:pilus assembly protein CpaE [Chloroflexota bacterium]